jgi:hypothetical protein
MKESYGNIRWNEKNVMGTRDKIAGEVNKEDPAEEALIICESSVPSSVSQRSVRVRLARHFSPK